MTDKKLEELTELLEDFEIAVSPPTQAPVILKARQAIVKYVNELIKKANVSEYWMV